MYVKLLIRIKDHLLIWRAAIVEDSKRISYGLLDRWITTIQSVVDLACDLIANLKYDYLLTRKLNQDRLEVLVQRSKVLVLFAFFFSTFLSFNVFELSQLTYVCIVI